jgi:hypothetical protein
MDSLTPTEGEMSFVWEQGNRYAPRELLARRVVVQVKIGHGRHREPEDQS